MLLTKNLSTTFLELGDDGILVDRPCWVYGVYLSSAGAGFISVALHDGFSSNSPIKFRFGWRPGYGLQQAFKYPVFFNKGVYNSALATESSCVLFYEYAEKAVVQELLLIASVQQEVDCILKDMVEWFIQYRSLLQKTQAPQTPIGRFYQLLRGWFIR